MMVAFRRSLAVAVGYLLGNTPSASAAERLAGGRHDLTTEGTGNPGAMNAASVLGARWGAAVTVADVAKATVAARVGQRVAGPTGANLAASAAVVGHCHPLGRPGGKGVAASIGQVIGTAPAYLPLDAATAAIATRLPWVRHRARAATAAGSVVWVTVTTLWWRRRWPNPGGPEVTWALPVGALVSSAVIAARFRDEAANVDAQYPDNPVPGRVDVHHDMETHA